MLASRDESTIDVTRNLETGVLAKPDVCIVVVGSGVCAWVWKLWILRGGVRLTSALKTSVQTFTCIYWGFNIQAIGEPHGQEGVGDLGAIVCKAYTARGFMLLAVDYNNDENVPRTKPLGDLSQSSLDCAGEINNPYRRDFSCCSSDRL